MGIQAGVHCSDIDITMFLQIWGSTCTGFDEDKDGNAVLSGSAMTREYTTVIHDRITDCYVVFFGEELCYLVTNANENFLNDLRDKSMASLSVARKRY